MTHVGRHTVDSEIVGRSAHDDIELDDDEIHHIGAEVRIEVSGADTDRPHTYALVEEIEDAVEDAIDDFDGADA